MIVVSGVAGTLVGPLPWPIETLPGFVQRDAVEKEGLAERVEAALADAGFTTDDLAWQPVGVFAAANGGDACALSRRFDWCGPAIGIDAECAGGLVALLLAADALALGECSLAVVFAEHHATPLPGNLWDETCAPLSAAAKEGASRAGTAVVVLARADGARRRRARLLGGTHRRLGSPSGMIGLSLRGVCELLEEGLARARLAPMDLGYCELHAIGTPVGDAVEIAAFGRLWGTGRRGDRCTRLGSHKSSFGHLEEASGLVSLARLLGWLETGVSPPTRWRQPFSPHAAVPPTLALCDGGVPAIGAGGCVALSRSGVGAFVLLAGMDA